MGHACVQEQANPPGSIEGRFQPRRNRGNIACQQTRHFCRRKGGLREGTGATLIASRLELNEWYLRIEGELMADSILGRTGSTSRYLDLDGPNMREYFAKKIQEEEASTN